MKLAELKSAGGFVPAAPVRHPVVWERAPGDVLQFDVFVRRLSFGMVERMLQTVGPESSTTAQLIAACVSFGDDGSETITAEDAAILEPSLAKVLAEAVREVNELGKRAS